MSSTSNPNQQQDMLLHLHPLNFSLNNLEELNSIELSLVPFHFNSNKNLSREAKILWLKRRDKILNLSSNQQQQKQQERGQEQEFSNNQDNNLVQIELEFKPLLDILYEIRRKNLRPTTNLVLTELEKEITLDNYKDLRIYLNKACKFNLITFVHSFYGETIELFQHSSSNDNNNQRLPPPLSPLLLRKYRALFYVLEENKRSGELRPSRGLLARQLTEFDKNLYELTQTKSFRFYIDDAFKDGIVRFGKTGNREWVELVNRVSENSLPINNLPSTASTSSSTLSSSPLTNLDSFYTTDLNFPFDEKNLINLSSEQLTLIHLKSYYHESSESRIIERAEIAWWKKRSRDLEAGLIWVEPDLISNSSREVPDFKRQVLVDGRDRYDDNYDRSDRTHRDEEPRDTRRRDENLVQNNDRRNRGGRDKGRDTRGRDRGRDSNRNNRSDSNQQSNNTRRRSRSRSRSRTRTPTHRPFSSTNKNKNQDRSRSYSPPTRPTIQKQSNSSTSPSTSRSRSRSRSRTVSISKAPLQPPSPIFSTNLNKTKTTNNKFVSTFQSLPYSSEVQEVEMKDINQSIRSEADEEESNRLLAVARQLALDSMSRTTPSIEQNDIRSPSPKPNSVPLAQSRPSEFNIRLQPTLKLHFPSLPTELKTVILRDDYFQSTPINVLAWTPGGPSEPPCTFYLAFSSVENLKQVEIFIEGKEVDWDIEGIIMSRNSTERWLEEDLVPRGVSEGYWCDDDEIDKASNLEPSTKEGEESMDLEDDRSSLGSPVYVNRARSKSPIPVPTTSTTNANSGKSRSRSLSPTVTPIQESSSPKRIRISSPISPLVTIPGSEASASTSKISSSPIRIGVDNETEFDIDLPIDLGPDFTPYPTTSFFGLPLPELEERDSSSSGSRTKKSSGSKSTRTSNHERSSESSSRKSSGSSHRSRSSSGRYRDDHHSSHSNSRSSHRDKSYSSRSRNSETPKIDSSRSSHRKSDHFDSARSSPEKSRDSKRETIEAEKVEEEGRKSRDSSVEIIEIPKIPKIEEE